MIETKNFFGNLYRSQRTLWSAKEPPNELVAFIKQRPPKKGGAALDIGCGEGYSSAYLAKQGFVVTGIDFSEIAISRAKKKARRPGLTCKFLVWDALRVEELGKEFDFILEWGLLHTIMPSERRRYIQGVKTVLKSEGIYMSASFSCYSQDLGGSGLKYRLAPKSHLWLYYSSHAELQRLFSQFFRIMDSRLISIVGQNHHRSVASYFLLQRE